MKRLPCPCLALPHFWLLGSHFMAQGSGTQAPGKGPSLSIQLLRAQYEGLRRQQRAQAHVVVLPKGGNMAAPAESMVSAVWINKERRHSLSLDEADPEAAGMLEEADRGCPQAPESPWHTHLEMHRLVQAFHQETSHQTKHKGKLMGSEQRLPEEGDPGLLENNQMTQQGTTNPEAAQIERSLRIFPVLPEKRWNRGRRRQRRTLKRTDQGEKESQWRVEPETSRGKR
uniref:Chromosome 25 C9orf152 homolog n=1 Tax=Equus caballus TaxID=9796 RepID=F6PLI4_HORSE